jgi:peptidoglycan/LPS O-acetylase OafA/YrhL
VDVFFVLSGFLITWLIIGEHDRSDSVDFRSFYMRRALRLLPALFAVMVVVSVVVLVWGRLAAYRNPTLSDLPWAIFYVGNYNINDLGLTNLLAHTWSLAVEEQFYLVWPWICVAIIRRGWQRQRVALTLVAAAVVEMIARFVYLYHFHWSILLSYHAIFLRSDGLLVGCAIAFAFTSPLIEWIKIRMVVRLMQIGAVGGVLVLALVVNGGLWELGQQWAYIPLTVIATGLVLVNLITTPLRPLAFVLSSRPAVWIGKRSYGLYLLHWPVFLIFATVHYHNAGEQFALIAAAFAVSFALAVTSWRFVEQPFNRIKRRYQADLPSEAVAPA